MAFLEQIAVNPQPELEVLRITQLVGRHGPRPHRAETVHALCEGSLGRCDVELELPRTDIVQNRVTHHVLQRSDAGDILCGSTDHDRELDFVVHLGDASRPADYRAGATHRRGKLRNDSWFFE